MALSTFMLFCNNHHHSSIQAFLTFLNWNSVPMKRDLPISLPQLLMVPFLLLISMNRITVVPHLSGIIVFFRVWLVSLSILSSRFTHVVACVWISLLLKDEWFSNVRFYPILFIHSSVKGHWGCFPLFSTVCNTTVMGVHIALHVPAFNSLGIWPEVEILDHMVIV